MTQDGPSSTGPRLDPVEPHRLVEWARGIVRSDILVVDLDDRDWMSSLALLIGAWREVVPVNIGLVLVPVAPHMRGYWLNAHVPAVTLECYLVPEEQVPELRAHIDRMWDALHPDA